MPKKKLSPEDRAYGRTAMPGSEKGTPAGGPKGVTPRVMRALARNTEKKGNTDTAQAARARADNIEGHQAMTKKAKAALEYRTTARRPK
jgi:hypothetical protein